MQLSWDSSSANVFTEVTGTYTFNDDDVRAVYLDWSDGTDSAGSFSNKKENANYQWYTTTQPTGAIAVPHTYTATGTFNPVVQVVNSKGFISHYTSSGAIGDLLPSGAVRPYSTTVGAMTTFTSYDGTSTGVMRLENKTVKSGIDNSIFEIEGAKDIGVLVPPLCSSAELTTIGSIILEIECVVESSMISTTDETIVGGAGTSIQTITETITSIESEEAIDPIDITGGKVKKILKVTYKNPKYVTSPTDFDSNAASKNLKIFIMVTGDDGNYYPITYVSPGSPIKRSDDPLRYVTLDFSQSRAKASNVSIDSYRYDNGKVWFSPVNQWNTRFSDSTCDPGDGVATMTMDNTAQILTGASVSGTGIDASTTVTTVNSATQLTLSDSSLTAGTNITCVFGYSQVFGTDTKQTLGTKEVTYTYGSTQPNGLGGASTVNSLRAIAFDNSSSAKWARNTSTQLYRTDQFIVDEFGRFTDQYHLTRMSADPNTTDKDKILNISSIVDNKPEVFRITPTLLSTMSLATSGSATKLDVAPAASGNLSEVYTNEAFQNGNNQLVSLSGMNTQTFNNFAGSARTDNEYILLLFSEKTNKVFLNINNYANGLIDTNLAGSSFTSPWKISGVSYLNLTDSGTRRQNANWTPLQFEDTTKVSMEYRDDTGASATSGSYLEQSNSLSQSGYISYDMPLDWSATTLENLCGGQFDTAMTTSTSGANDIIITGTVGDLGTAGSNGFGGVLEFGSGNSFTGAEVLNGIINEDVFGSFTEIGAFKYMAFCVDTGSSTAANCENKPLWVASGTSDGMDLARKRLYLTYGEDDTSYVPSNLDTNTAVKFLIRRVNIYDVFNGVSKVEEGDGASASLLVPVDCQATAFPSTYMIAKTDGTAVISGSPLNLGKDLKTAWSGNSLYALKIELSGAAGAPGGVTEDVYPGLWNIFDGNKGYGDIIKEVDDSAYNLNALPITSDIGIGRGGAYYTAITRKGKVFISRTGDTIESIGFSSVALGDGTFTTYSTPQSLYGQLRKIRALHDNNVRVFWDEVQKDGTYARYWGIITAVDESHGVGGPKSIVNYNFNMMVEEVALIDIDGHLMTDLFPLGGIGNEKDFT